MKVHFGNLLADRLASMVRIRLTRALSLLALATVCCACAGPSDAPTPQLTQEATSTVSQWASLIAQQQAQWDDWQTKWDEASCSSITAATPDGGDCRLKLLGASFQVQTTAIGYQLATGPRKKGFIAKEPPAEIAPLFSETIAASTAAEAAGAAWTDARCDLETAPSCGGLAFTFESAIDDLRSQFDAWHPYM